jgi:hypothetical protein
MQGREFPLLILHIGLLLVHCEFGTIQEGESYMKVLPNLCGKCGFDEDEDDWIDFPLGANNGVG